MWQQDHMVEGSGSEVGGGKKPGHTIPSKHTITHLPYTFTTSLQYDIILLLYLSGLNLMEGKLTIKI